MAANSNSKALASIGVLTSGGDSQGMNCVLYGLIAGARNMTEVYLIHDGYQGLVTGGPKLIEKGDLEQVGKYLHQGGTIIGSSRCQEFRTADGRKKAARNLLERNISNLVVIGGDGSLTGANLLRQEWPDIVAEWGKESKVPTDNLAKLNLVGIIGSIDNDFQGTDMTVGADSALFRIQEAIDILRTTAKSHGRAMVVEVMGRNCGYLALSSALATEATYVFVPECPHADTNEWQSKLKARITFERSHKQKFHFIIVAEGACSENGDPISAQAIRDYLDKGLGLDARAVVLAHTQRGGKTSAFDRLMSVQLGIDAFHTIKSAPSEGVVLTINNGHILAKPLMDCVAETTKLNRLMKQRKWNEVVTLRGEHFLQTWNNFRDLMSNHDVHSDQGEKSPCWAVAHVGEPVPGMNSVLYAVVRYAYARNIRVIAWKNGLEGLKSGHFEPMLWETVSGYSALSGSVLGSKTIKLSDEAVQAVADALNGKQVQCLCLVGDHSALKLAKQLKGKMQGKVCFIPASVNPQAELSSNHCKLGFDSVLNKTCELLSDLTSQGAHNRLYLIRLNLAVASCDFVQPSLFGQANSALYCYPSSKALFGTAKLDATQVSEDANSLQELMQSTRQTQLVLIHESLFSQVVDKYLAAFSNLPQVTTTVINLSSLQMPQMLTPFDRKLGVKMGMRCGQFFAESSNSNAVVLLNAQTFELLPI